MDDWTYWKFAHHLNGLGNAAQELGGKAMRLSAFDGYDLSKKLGLQRALMTLAMTRPRRVVLAPPCAARSQVQNMDQRAPEKTRRLEE